PGPRGTVGCRVTPPGRLGIAGRGHQGAHVRSELVAARTRGRDPRGPWQAGAAHAERPKDAGLNLVLEVPPGDCFDEQTEQNAVRVRIVKALSRGEVWRMTERDAQQFVPRPALLRLVVEYRVEHEVLAVVVEAARHVEELADRDVFAVGHASEIA